MFVRFSISFSRFTLVASAALTTARALSPTVRVVDATSST